MTDFALRDAVKIQGNDGEWLRGTVVRYEEYIDGDGENASLYYVNLGPKLGVTTFRPWSLELDCD
jgi:hypothetical protein